MLANELISRVRRIEITTRQLVENGLAGEYHSVFKGRGMEFDEVRHYIPGDDVRSIDWNVTARTGEPYVKSYVEERFKKRSHKATFGASDGHWDRNKVDGRRVRIPVLGWVRMREELRFNGRIVKMRCVREASGWHVAITVDLGVEPRRTRRRRVVGVDVGVRTLACTSDGNAYANPRALTGARRELRRVQKAIARSRKVHGRNRPSHRRLKLYTRLRKLHARVAHIRKNAHRHIAAAIAKSCGRVVVETLNVSGMLKNRRLSRAISDAGLGALIAEIEWQCAKRGVAFEKRDQWFASSKTCARCG